MTLSALPRLAMGVLLLAFNAPAAVRYVNLHNPSPASPYTAWATAATNVQDAIDVATVGDQVLVTNGVYRCGGLAVNGSVTNRVAITNAVTVRSVNGPRVTVIEGQPADSGPTTRCAYVADGAALIGFTLTNGLARPTSSEPAYEEIQGGGVFAQSTNALILHCILAGNAAADSGGGAYGGTLDTCLLIGNSAVNYGGGASTCVLNHCTVVENSALIGGGVDSCSLQSCIAYFNNATVRYPNFSGSTLNFCCATPLPATGAGNIIADPQLADFPHLSAASPCRAAAGAASGTDIDGEAWFNPSSIGCDEFYPVSSGELSVAVQTLYTNVAAGFELNFTGSVAGHASAHRWDFGDGNIVSNQLAISHAWQTTGAHPVVFTAFNDGNLSGVSATVTVQVVTQPVSYVSFGNPAAAAPYASWATAATTIQDAVDAASTAGALVLVSNGVYGVGGRAIGGVSNRVVATRALILRSVNGPAATLIQGDSVTAGLYLVNGAVINGFTITNGAAPDSGGGLTCESLGVVVSNCVFTGDSSGYYGGAAVRGTYYNCSFVANSAWQYAAGAYGATLTGCSFNGNSCYSGGGAVGLCMLTNCSLTTNSAFFGGAADSSVLANCLLTFNSGVGGGGASSSTLYDCDLLTNNAQWYGGGGASSSELHGCSLSGNSADYGGGAADSQLNNCVLTGNWAGSVGGGASGGTLTNCNLTGNWSYNTGGGIYASLVQGSALAGNVATNSGGGVDSGTLIDCVLSGNAALADGGGAIHSSLINCALYGNSCSNTGGGVYSCGLTNCTLTGNVASLSGGGAQDSTLNNSIVFYNSARADANYSGAMLSFSCSSPLPKAGAGNISIEPGLADAAHLGAASPCRGSGSALYSTGRDIDGESWLNPPSMGCDEYGAGSTGPLTLTASADFTRFVQGFSAHFSGRVVGHAAASWWDFGDGTFATNQLAAEHSWAAGGDYAVVLRAVNDSNPGGVSATVMVHVVSQSIYFVNASSANPVAPFATWDTAAATIQDAVEAGPVGATILVTNGVYQLGGRPVYGTLTNRVAITKPQLVCSLNGAAVTAIEGHAIPETVFGDGAVRCVYLGYNAVLAGFTLTNGSTRVIPSDERDDSQQQSGGGVWCEYSAVVSNCVFSGNSAFGFGAGLFGGSIYHSLLLSNSVSNYGGAANSAALYDCTLANNSAYSGGGAYNCDLYNCQIMGNHALYGEAGAAEGGTLNHCVLADNSAPYGGGVWNATLNYCVVSNNVAGAGAGAGASTLNGCLISGNSADYGGGAYASTLNGCSLFGNRADQGGGGAAESALNNCTVTGNAALAGAGGAHYCTANNSILYYNYAPVDGSNYLGSSLMYCCTAPLPSDGEGNLAGEPQLSDFSHVSAGSPCRATGSAELTVGQDIDGEPWANPPSIGCDEFYTNGTTGDLTVQILAAFTNVTIGYPLELQADITGHARSSQWDFGDGSGATNRPYLAHAWSSPGDYAVELRAYNPSHPAGVSAVLTVHVLVQPVHFVDASSLHPVAPFDSWATAATSIQDAVDAAMVPGALVLVTNGTYFAGQAVVRGFLTNRVAVEKFITVQSVNGPAGTAIDGGGRLRCVYLTNGAALSGFTLTNGYSATAGAGAWCDPGQVQITNCVFAGNLTDDSGGGAFGGVLSGCTFIGNSATGGGGGASGGTLCSCLLSNNSAGYGGGANGSTLTQCTLLGNSSGWGGGAYSSTLSQCDLAGNSATNNGGGVSSSIVTHGCFTGNSAAAGGAADSSTLTDCALNENQATGHGGGGYSCNFSNCTFTANTSTVFGGGTDSSFVDHCQMFGNQAGFAGGGVYLSQANNCLVASNSAGSYAGGGAYYCTLNNCTVIGNSAPQGGGVKNSTANNCIVYFNTGEDYDFTSTLNYCCTMVSLGGVGNITNNPRFLDAIAGDFRLQTNSPCINAGANSYASPGTDLGNRPRIVGDTVDVGAYEFQTPASLLSYAWLEQYGLATDGSADFADTDHDGLNNWQEWKAGTIPTDAASVLKMNAPSNSLAGITVSWQSVSGKTYFLERSTNLLAQPAFWTIQDNLSGGAITTMYTDRTATNGGPYFYRVGVQ